MTRTIKTFILLCLLLLGVIGGARVQAQALSGYTLSFDDNFTNAPVSGTRSATYPTAVGTGANSTTGVGNGWIDFIGNVYFLNAAGVLSDGGTNSPGNVLPLNSLYRPASENYMNGYVLAYTNNYAGVGLTARFSAASGGSGYASMIYSSNQLFIYKAVAGTQTNLLSGFAMGTLPTNFVEQLVVTEPTAGTAQITVNIYAPGALTTVVATKTITDATASLQSAGAWGVSSYSGSQWTRVQTAYVSSALSAGTASVSFAAKTKLFLTASAPIGGTPPYTYQWSRSTTSGAETAVTGLTTQTVTDTGLTAGTPYYYKVSATDSAGTPATVTSAEIGTSTLAVNANIIEGIGDSTLFGFGLASPSTQNPFVQMGSNLSRLFLYPATGISNDGVSGTTTTTWQPGSSYLNTAEANANAYGATDVWFRLGINDSKDGGANTAVTAAVYKSNVQAIITHVKTTCPTVQRFWVSYPQWVTINTQWDAASQTALLGYQSPINALVTANAPFTKIGNTLDYTFFQSNPSELNDGVHPNLTGATDLGLQDAQVFDKGLTGPTGTALALTITQNGSSQPVLTWTADPAATLYKVLRSTDGANYTVIATPAVGTLTYTDTARPAGATVYYHITSSH